MEAIDPRRALARLIADDDASYAALSRMLRRNDAYLQQYVMRGTPRILAERDRKLLAGYFRVDEGVLGGASGEPAMVAIRRLDIAASAGPGAIVEGEWALADLHFDPRLLARLGIAPGMAAVLAASGDSMAPGIEDGDLMLVDERDRRVGAKGAVFVIRLDGALMVKRVSRSGGALRVVSDNPVYSPLSVDAVTVEVIGRVVWLSRALR